MDSCKIIEYSLEYEHQLKEYMRYAFPRYSNQYIDYCVNSAYAANEGDLPSLLVLNEECRIVGCHLFYNTKVMINGQEYHTRWGHDTILDEQYRSKMGFQFVLRIASIPAYGIGLSDVNREIQKKLKTAFMDGLYNYCSFNCAFPFSVFSYGHKPFSLTKDIRVINISGKQFVRIDDANEINDIPNGGYWCKGNIAVDFIRDKQFFKKRFFEQQIYKYSFYRLAEQNAYFVVRPIRFKGFKALFLVDFRYDIKNSEQLKCLFKAVNTLAKKNNIGVIVWMSSDEGVESFFRKKKTIVKRPYDFFAKGIFRKFKDESAFVTAADADEDFMR